MKSEEEIKREKVKEFLASPTRDREALLVLLGLKPAAEIYSDEPGEAIAALRKLGLCGAIKGFDKKTNRTEICVAADESILEKFKSLLPDNDHEEYGRLMGYPDSAISAFLDDDKRLPFEEQDKLCAKYPFFKFAFSKEHFQEEEDILKKWNLAVFDYAPEFIDEVYAPESAIEFKNNLAQIKKSI